MKESILTKNAPQPIGPYSQAIKYDNMLFISGQIPMNPETEKLVQLTDKIQVELDYPTFSDVLNSDLGIKSTASEQLFSMMNFLNLQNPPGCKFLISIQFQ